MVQVQEPYFSRVCSRVPSPRGVYLAFSLGTGIKSAYFKIKNLPGSFVMCLNHHISFSHFFSPF